MDLMVFGSGQEAYDYLMKFFTPARQFEVGKGYYGVVSTLPDPNLGGAFRVTAAMEKRKFLRSEIVQTQVSIDANGAKVSGITIGDLVFWGCASSKGDTVQGRFIHKCELEFDPIKAVFKIDE